MPPLSRNIGVALVLLVLSPIYGPFDAQSTRETGSRSWVVPRTADGRPDLQGVWENNSATPLERPRTSSPTSRGSQTRNSSRWKRPRATLFGPDAEATFGDALQVTLLAIHGPTRTGRDWLVQSELAARLLLRAPDLADRPSGRREKTAAAYAGRSQAPCRGGRTVRKGWRLGPGFLASAIAAFTTASRICSPCTWWSIASCRRRRYVAIQMEKIDDARIIPLDCRPHVPPAFRNYLGDSRGKVGGRHARRRDHELPSKGQSDGRLLPRCRTRTSGSSSASAASADDTHRIPRLPSTTPPCGRSRGRP